MKIVFLTTHAHMPDVFGGGQRAVDELARHLGRQGHDVTLICRAGPEGLRSGAVETERGPGYAVFRCGAPTEALPSAAAFIAPDVVVIVGGAIAQAAHAADRLGAPSIVMLHNVEGDSWGGAFLDRNPTPFVANSAFTARRFARLTGNSAQVLPPILEFDVFAVDRRGEAAIFVNPIGKKGVEIVLRLAEARPDAPIQIFESWGLSETWRARCQERFAGLDNVLWRPACDDPQEIFGQARLLLMPSVWEESYGRTVAEAQVSGVPTLASDRGALPDQVGEGGLCVSVGAEDDAWRGAFDALWDDHEVYARCSAGALRRSDARRVEVADGLAQFEALLGEIAGRSDR